MSLGTLYIRNRTRRVAPVAIIKDLKLDVKIVDADESDNYAKIFPLNLAPALVEADGTLLNEAIAITIYLTELSKEGGRLSGYNAKEKAQVLKWLSFGSTDLGQSIRAISLPFLEGGYNKKAHDEALAKSKPFVDHLEDRLVKNTYLVAERITAADYFIAGLVELAFRSVWDREFIAAHPAIYRWFNTVINNKPLSDIIVVPYHYIDKAVPKKEPKKEPAKKKEQPKAKAKPKAQPKPKDDDEDDIPKEKKVAHPLAALAPAALAIDSWKRTYSNEETRETALPWFWEHYDPKDYSLWKVAYKYNDELTLTFMSNNLVGGFFNRLSASTKYLFGSMVVYGENNNNGIIGVFLVRGQDYAPAFDVAPDWDSYEYTKLDASKPQDKALVEDLWAWDKPVEINGEQRQIADGKVFK